MLATKPARKLLNDAGCLSQGARLGVSCYRTRTGAIRPAPSQQLYLIRNLTLKTQSKRIEKLSDEKWRITGELTIRDVTKEVVLETEFEGQIKDAYGKQRAAFAAETAISRKEFGLNWNGLIETGGVVVGDKVKVALNVAAVRRE